jgi:very-short-patch-repair endonuclease
MANTFNRNLHLDANRKLYQYARDLRGSQTLPEDILWQYLRSRRLDGLKFRRQHPLVEYVADFYCHEKKLVIELDGAVHDTEVNKDYDEARTNWLADLDVTVIRFRNKDVLHNLESVITAIRNCIKEIDQLKHK